MSAPASQRSGASTALFAFAAFAAWFAWRAAPGVTFEDSGELASAVATGGVAHPPGYPFLLLAGRAWVELGALFGAEPARALNLFSAVCAAGACALVALTLRRLGAGVGAALAAALLLALSPTFAAQAGITEVYAPASLLLAALACVALTAAHPALASGLLLGLACAAHQGSAFFAPLALASVLRERGGARSVGRALLGVALGLALYLYLPLAAASDPPVNWGEVTSLDAFREHVLRAQYHTSIERAWGAQLSFLVEQLLLQWPLALGLALAGLVFGRRAPAQAPLGRPASPRAALGWLTACLAVAAVGLLLATNYPMEPSTRWRVAGAYSPLVLLASLVAGLGFAGLERALAGRVPRASLAVGLPSVALVLALPLGPETLVGAGDVRGRDEAEAYAREVLEACPPNALLVISDRGYSDVLGFPLLYAQVVLGLRPDVLVIDRESLELGWMRAQLARRHPELAPGLARLDARLTSEQARGLGPAERRVQSIPFLQELFDGVPGPAGSDGPRPVVSVTSLGERVLGGRALWPGPSLWHVGQREALAPASAQLGWTWLPGADSGEDGRGDPWLHHLRELARERDLARAKALPDSDVARAARARWGE